MKYLITILLLGFFVSSEAQNVNQSQIRQFNAVPAYRVFGRGSGAGSPSFIQLDSNHIPLLHSQGYYDLRYGSLSVQNTNTSNIATSYQSMTAIDSTRIAFNRLNGTKDTVTFKLSAGASIGTITWLGTTYNANSGNNITLTTPTTANISESGNLYYTDTKSRAAISLTTTGTSGAATYNNTTGVLNIPSYTAGSGGTSGWALTGNTATDTTTNFIGTTDLMTLNFKVNNVRSGYIGRPTTVSGGNSSTGFGYSALLNNTGLSTTAFGTGALATANSGLSNSAFGAFALGLNSSGYFNTAVGVGALSANTTGLNNTATGANALNANTTAQSNTAFGAYALSANTTGTPNTAVGFEALKVQTTGGNSNTALGYQTLSTNNGGIQNTATGHMALRLNTSGQQNNAVGAFAMQTNTSGSFNAADGRQTLNNNTTGSYNTAVGMSAGWNNTTGTGNVYLGSWAGLTNATANNKLYVGSTSVGSGTIYNLLHGDFSTGQLQVNPAATPALTASAAFEVLTISGAIKGSRLSAMTNTDRDSITSPAEGLIIYSLTDHTYEFWNGTVWKQITTN